MANSDAPMAGRVISNMVQTSNRAPPSRSGGASDLNSVGIVQRNAPLYAEMDMCEGGRAVDTEARTNGTPSLLERPLLDLLRALYGPSGINAILALCGKSRVSANGIGKEAKAGPQRR